MSRASLRSKMGRYVASLCALLGAMLLVSTPSFAAPAAIDDNWTPVDILLPEYGSAHEPALEDFKGRLFIAITASDSDYNNPLENVYINSVKQGGADAGSWVAIPDMKSSSGPAIKVYKSRLYLALRGPNDQVFVTSSKDGKKWDTWVAVPGAITTASPALKVYKNRLYLAIRGTDNNIHIASVKSGQKWGDWTTIPGSATNNQPAMTQFQDKLYVAFTGLDGQIYLTKSSNGTSWSSPMQAPGWGDNCDNPPTGPMRTLEGPGVTTLNGKLYLSAATGGCDVDDFLELNSFDGTNWSGWEKSPQYIDYTPALTTFKDDLYMATTDYGYQGYVHLIVRDGDD